jgi:hypothetical protein
MNPQSSHYCRRSIYELAVATDWSSVTCSKGSVMMRCIKAAVLVCLCALGTGAAFAHDEPGERQRLATGDKIRIVAFEPSGTVRRGVDTQFTIQIEVDLQSAKEGVARVGFNLDSPTSFRMIDSRDLHEGIQKVNFTVKAKPVDWADRGYFAMMVNMGPKTTEAQWTPTALAHKAIPVKR